MDVVLFDFGGVLAEEGFREGLKAIGRRNRIDPDEFFNIASEAVYSSGYVLGRTDEEHYWDVLRQKAGIAGTNEHLREEILSRFVLRPRMIELVREVRSRARLVGILSDQSNWLDELDQTYSFFKEFDRVFNSFHLGKGKRDPSLFRDVTDDLGVAPSRTVFIDDAEGNVERAREQGLEAILFQNRDDLVTRLKTFGLLPESYH